MRSLKIAVSVILALASTAACQTVVPAAPTDQSDWFSLGANLAAAASAPSPTPDQEPQETIRESGESKAPPAAHKDWEVSFKVYAWIPDHINGDVGFGPGTAPVDIDFRDVLEGIHKVHCIVPINVDARVGHWGFNMDLLYVRVKAQSAPGEADIVSKQWILELAGYYRVGTWPACPGSTSTISWDILGGARLNRIEKAVALGLLDSPLLIGETEEWWDPFFGPRVTWQATRRLRLFARGDVGGFGIEGCSHFAWQFIGGADYNITENIFLEVAYRLLDTDFETGSGANHFVYDLQMAGPYLAAGVRF